MSSIYIHVGLGKTGSSSIQKYLQKNLNLLNARNIYYPSNSSPMPSGNGHLLYSAMEENDTSYFRALQEYPISLISREHFARELSNQTIFKQLVNQIEPYYEAKNINIIAYIRDPVKHCYSLWAQKLKNSKTQLSLRSFAATYDSYTILTKFLNLANSQGWNIHLIDYDQIKDNLLESFFQCMTTEQFPLCTDDDRFFINKSPSGQDLMRQWISLNLSSLLKINLKSRSRFIRHLSYFLPPPNMKSWTHRINDEIVLYNDLKALYIAKPTH